MGNLNNRTHKIKGKNKSKQNTSKVTENTKPERGKNRLKNARTTV